MWVNTHLEPITGRFLDWGTRIQVPLVLWTFNSAKAAFFHSKALLLCWASANDLEWVEIAAMHWAIFASSSSESFGSLPNWVGLSFHHSQSGWQFLVGSRAPIPTGLGPGPGAGGRGAGFSASSSSSSPWEGSISRAAGGSSSSSLPGRSGAVYETAGIVLGVMYCSNRWMLRFILSFYILLTYLLSVASYGYLGVPSI